MHLKRIEVAGFKSFAKRTVLDLENSITAVIGPNGCGKSNIADAVRWVLGEQNPRLMRGNKMEDVIFNGTDEKKPVGRAEVTITFDNSDMSLQLDYNEVSITRRLYRSGDSEYLINNTRCRLKDIRDLFLGTGVGTNAYSVLEQGKVDLVLNSKPEDRRFVFEEAAGITKYKTKKKEALQKLEITDRNLLRIADVIREVKRQKGSLERQAGRAKRYKTLREELKDLEVKLALREFNEFEEKLALLEKNKGDKASQRSKKLDTLADIQSQIDIVLRDLQEVSNKIEENSQKKMQAEYEIQKHEHQRDMNSSQIADIEKTVSRLEGELSDTDKRITGVQLELEDLKKAYTYLDREEVPTEETLAKISQKVEECEKEIAATQHIIEQKKSVIIDHLQKIAECKNHIFSSEEKIKQSVLLAEKIMTETEDLNNRISQKKDKLDELHEQKKSYEKDIDLIRRDISKTHMEISGKQEQLSSLVQELGQQRHKHSQTISRRNIIDELCRSYEGVDTAVKTLLTKRKESAQEIEFPGIIGELLKINGGYDRAIESFLAESLQNVVIKNDQQLLKNINYIDENVQGRITFWPLVSLDRILPKAKVDENDAGILGRAIDFVECKEDWKPLFQYLLGNVFIIKDRETLMRLRKEKKTQGIHYVTQDGEIAYDDGRLTCGRNVSEKIGLLERKTELKKLIVQTGTLEKTIHKLEKQKNDFEDEIAGFKEHHDNNEKKLKHKEYLLSNLLNDITRLDARVHELGERLAITKRDRKERVHNTDELKKKILDLQKLQNEMLKQKELSEKEVFEHEKKLNDYRELREQTMLDYTKIKTNLANFQEKEQSLLSQVKAQEHLVQNYSSITEVKKQDIDAAKNKKVLLEKSISEGEKMLQELKKILAACESQKYILRERRTKLEQVQQEKAVSKERIARSLDSFKDEVHKCEMEQTELRVKLENISGRIFEKYTVDLKQCQTTSELFDIEEVLARITEVREYLKKIGPVDLIAIDEYDEIRERYEFLVKQEEDLINAKENLAKAINQINRMSKQQFIETFEKIRTNFHEIFKKLFNGGKADLIMIDETDALETGIEIVARPPGKKLQNISLLSGGERSLTAISLLLALFRVNPSPFCVMDEMDAALDDSNVGRFIELLEEFTRETQFVLITHNKNTVSVADIIYGVTMEEFGVSRIISVKLQKKDESTPEEEPVTA